MSELKLEQSFQLQKYQSLLTKMDKEKVISLLKDCTKLLKVKTKVLMNVEKNFNPEIFSLSLSEEFELQKRVSEFETMKTEELKEQLLHTITSIMKIENLLVEVFKKDFYDRTS